MQAQQSALKRMVSVFLEAEKRQVSLLEDCVRTMAEKQKAEELQEKRPNSEGDGDFVLDDTPQKREGPGVESEGASETTDITKVVPVT
jgi:hypothetical protein